MGSKNRGRNLALGTILVGLAGYVVGILTAPKSGKETRRDIQRKAAQAKSQAEKKLKSMHSELSELIAAGKKKAKDAKATVKDDLNDALAKAQAAKDKAREMLSAIHEGDADDEDLKQAIKDISEAVQHLKKFITKDAK
jgi:gas vesicle protein